jgi:hypothetical protein
VIVLYKRDDRAEVTQAPNVANFLKEVVFEEKDLIIMGIFHGWLRVRLDNLFVTEFSGVVFPRSF